MCCGDDMPGDVLLPPASLLFQADAAKLLPETPVDPVVELLISLGLLRCTKEQFRACVEELLSRGHLPRAYAVAICLNKCMIGQAKPSGGETRPLTAEQGAAVDAALAGLNMQDLADAMARVPGFNCTIQELRECIARMLESGVPAKTAIALCLAQCVRPRAGSAAEIDEATYGAFLTVPGFNCTIQQLRDCVRDLMAGGTPARVAMALCLARCVRPRPSGPGGSVVDGGGSTASGGMSTPGGTRPPNRPCTVEAYLTSIEIANRDATGNEWQFTLTANGQRWVSSAKVAFTDNHGRPSTDLGFPVQLASITGVSCGDSVAVPVRLKAEQFEGRNDRARVEQTFVVACPSESTQTIVAQVHDNNDDHNPSSTITCRIRLTARCL